MLDKKTKRVFPIRIETIKVIKLVQFKVLKNLTASTFHVLLNAYNRSIVGEIFNVYQVLVRKAPFLTSPAKLQK